MKKLTAGIFAGILTIVTVNAADAAITSKAYVDGLIEGVEANVTQNTTNITNLTKTVSDNKTAAEGAIADLKETVDGLTGDGTGSVADQIAGALGELGEGTTVKAELDKKQNKSSAAYSMGGENGAWTVMTQAQQDALNSEITKADVTQITTNKDAITEMGVAYKAADKAITDKIGDLTTLGEGKTVLDLIDDAKTTVTEGVDTKLGEGFDENNTVVDALDKKQDTLGATNVTTNGDGNVVSAVTAKDGVITVSTTSVVPEVTTTGQTGTFVLTATVTADGVANYMWESIERTAPATQE